MIADRPRTGRVFWLPVLLFALIFLTANRLRAVPRIDDGVTVPAGGIAPVVSFDLIEGGFSSPVAVTNAGDERLFVVEQAGVIKIFANGNTLATPFLNITSMVTSGGERGLLGLAFSPDYATNGEFYVNYTFTESGQLWTKIARYHVSANPDIADPAEETVLVISQDASNHNGGDIHFGHDGYLYIGMGDGGNQNDPLGHAQDGASLKGKILRIAVTGQSTYAIPSNNPYVGVAGVRDEIWAFGLRNPWRWSFDAATGAMWIGDVGQNSWEEINYVASSHGGRNYGWNCYEGTHQFALAGPACDNGINHTPPIHEYSHSIGRSVTGGFVYRGPEYPRIGGYYFFADFSLSKVWSLNRTGAAWNLTSYAAGISNPSAFGEGMNGELYLLSYGGALYEITEEAGTTGQEPRVYFPVMR